MASWGQLQLLAGWSALRQSLRWGSRGLGTTMKLEHRRTPSSGISISPIQNQPQEVHGLSYYRIADTSVSEGSSYANFTISRSGDTAYSERVLAYTGNGSATNNSDYSYKRDYVYFNPYETSKTLAFQLLMTPTQKALSTSEFT